MQQPRVLFVSTYPPLHCGIATFARSLADAVDEAVGTSASAVAAICPHNERPAFDRRVIYRIDNSDPHAYLHLVDFINSSNFDVVSLQHEYGLFPGQWGIGLLKLLQNCTKPIVATLHTVLPEPNSMQLKVMSAMAEHCRKIVVMAETGIDLLVKRYGIGRHKLAFIQHGVPDFQQRDRRRLRRKLCLHGHKIIMTFGLLSRGKGIEHVIEALPEIVARHKHAQYVLVGQTHPAIRRIEGESYRDELCRLARKLGVSDHLRLENRYIADQELMDWLQACDVYVTPYVGRDQITSGTLSYALAAGCAIVSTPYLYAREVLADGRGRLAQFLSAHSMAENISAILGDPAYHKALRKRAFDYGRRMRWSNVGAKYRDLFLSMASRQSRAS